VEGGGGLGGGQPRMPRALAQRSRLGKDEGQTDLSAHSRIMAHRERVVGHPALDHPDVGAKIGLANQGDALGSQPTRAMVLPRTDDNRVTSSPRGG
jgi:hypothetical protein